MTGFPLFADTTWLDLLVVFGGLAFVSWPGYARLIRGQIFSLREEQYIEAAKSVGVTELKIAVRHLLPNALGPVIVTLTFSFSSAMVLESSLSTWDRRSAPTGQLGQHDRIQHWQLVLPPLAGGGAGIDPGDRDAWHKLPGRRSERRPQSPLETLDLTGVYLSRDGTQAVGRQR